MNDSIHAYMLRKISSTYIGGPQLELALADELTIPDDL